MYEGMTYDFILGRMLGRVPNDVDKREGSVIYDALAPAAAELAQMYAELDVALSLSFGTTASGDFLDRRAADFGIARQVATRALRRGLFYGSGNAPLDVPIGSRYSVSGVTYSAKAKVAAGEFELECEKVGVAGNQSFGTLLPIEYVPGLVRAELAGVLVPGENVETDEALRKRYLDRVRTPSTSGNRADYRIWALDVPGVGDAYVAPLWAGPGTVKLFILDANKAPATPQLVADVQHYISPEAGEGGGMAPIGAAVTVVPATGVSISVSAAITLDNSRTLAQVKADFERALTSYLQSIAFGADAGVKYVRIGALLLDVDGVKDYSALLVNGAGANVSVAAGAVAIKGMVTFT